MKREDIIRMAREAGCSPFEFGVTIAHVEDLGRFAALVAAAAKADEREAFAKWLEDVVDAPNWAEQIRARGQA